jgi:hypothetical protein
MSKVIRFVVGSVVLTGVGAGAIKLYQRFGSKPAQPDEAPAPTPDTPAPSPDSAPEVKQVPPQPVGASKLGPIAWDNLIPLPVAADVPFGDVTRNWGKTPVDLRPLLLEIEFASGIHGVARILAIIAKRESAYKPTAHNGDEEKENGERSASWRAYWNNKDRNPPLVHGEVAANFGSGGLFGGLAPYALWTGVQEMKDKAPLLGSDPRILFLPRVAGFVAAVYMQRLLRNYDIRDHADIKVGWGSVSLLSEKGRKDSDYARIRQRFYEDAAELGIDLSDETTIPRTMNADAWPGVAAVFDKVVIKLPTPGKVTIS